MDIHRKREAASGRFGGRTLLILCGTAALLLAGCATDGEIFMGNQVAQANTQARSANDLLVVDCVLPSPVRRLGWRIAFLGPRQAIKTSVGDCESRGGDYAAYDRADYLTALNVWLPLTESGDPEVRT